MARRVHDEVGPELDLDADDIEQMAITAARAVARGTIADLLERKAALLGPEQPCPTCQRPCAYSASRGPSTSGSRGHLRRAPVPLPGLPPGFFSLSRATADVP